jgi:hypothetical protein
MGGYRNEMPKHDWRVNLFFGFCVAIAFLVVGEIIWRIMT